MTIGFVLIGSKPGSERNVYAELTRITEITELHPVFGEYDIIARLEAPDPNALMPIVEKIRKVDGVIDTKTLPGISCYGKKA